MKKRPAKLDPKLKIGSVVWCTYRAVNPMQPWLGSSWLGIIRDYTKFGSVYVEYPFGITLDSPEHLRQAHPPMAWRVPTDQTEKESDQ